MEEKIMPMNPEIKEAEMNFSYTGQWNMAGNLEKICLHLQPGNETDKQVLHAIEVFLEDGLVSCERFGEAILISIERRRGNGK